MVGAPNNPNGSIINWCNPNGVVKAVISLDKGDKGIYQYLHYIYIYIYLFSRRFYPKRITIEEYNKRCIIKR